MTRGTAHSTRGTAHTTRAAAYSTRGTAHIMFPVAWTNSIA